MFGGGRGKRGWGSCKKGNGGIVGGSIGVVAGRRVEVWVCSGGGGNESQ